MPICDLISLGSDGLAYRWYSDAGRQHHDELLNWIHIETVDVFKRDIFAYDLICLVLQGDSEHPLEFDEEDPLWKEFTAALPKHLAGCETQADWFYKVIAPAFEPCARRIYERPLA